MYQYLKHDLEFKNKNLNFDPTILGLSQGESVTKPLFLKSDEAFDVFAHVLWSGKVQNRDLERNIWITLFHSKMNKLKEFIGPNQSNFTPDLDFRFVW